MTKEHVNMRKSTLLLLSFLLTVSATAQTSQRDQIREKLADRIAEKQAVNDSGDPVQFIDVAGLRRSYIAHLPLGYDGKSALPLVIVFHGGGGNAANAARMSAMSAKGDKEKFIAVYPNGTGRQPDRFLTWNKLALLRHITRKQGR